MKEFLIELRALMEKHNVYIECSEDSDEGIVFIKDVFENTEENWITRNPKLILFSDIPTGEILDKLDFQEFKKYYS